MANTEPAALLKALPLRRRARRRATLAGPEQA